VARSTVIDGPGGLPAWRCGLYAWMTRQSEGAAGCFNLPPNRAVEPGTQVMLQFVGFPPARGRHSCVKARIVHLNARACRSAAPARMRPQIAARAPLLQWRFALMNNLG
jgi:hypothetical protein